LVIKGGEIGYQLRFSFTKTLLLFYVSVPIKKYKRATNKTEQSTRIVQIFTHHVNWNLSTIQRYMEQYFTKR
jgi:hypothetical protein